MRFLLAVILVACGHTLVFATDLTQIDRRITREPAYQTRPKYCLLVFGPDVKHRVWLVQDGDVLYVDRNGNGDLTEVDEKIPADKEESRAGGYAFTVPEIRVGDQVHKSLYVSMLKVEYIADRDPRAKALVAKDPRALAHGVQIQMEMPGWKGTGVGGRVVQRAFFLDVNGVLQFAERPAEAPILHFGGPLEIALFGRHELKIGRETDVVLGVRSPGVGPGSHTWIDYDDVIPANANPTVEFVFPPKIAGEPPIRVKHELKQRC
jgi:hypothetical protein